MCAESIDEMMLAYNDVLADFNKAVEEREIYKKGFGVSKRSQWMYESMEHIEDLVGVGFDELAKMKPGQAIKTVLVGVQEKAKTEHERVFYLESFACDASIIGPRIEAPNKPRYRYDWDLDDWYVVSPPPPTTEYINGDLCDPPPQGLWIVVVGFAIAIGSIMAYLVLQ